MGHHHPTDLSSTATVPPTLLWWPDYSPKEVDEDPDAKDALKFEGKRLEKQGAWDISTIRKYDNLMKDAQAKDEKIHVSRIFPLRSEKGGELKKRRPERKLKG